MTAKKALFIIPVAVVLVLLLALALVPANITQANGPLPNTIYVNGTTGNDAWNGTQPTGGAPNGPKQTIQAGIDAVNPEGGTVYVAAGTYYENLWLDQAQNLVGEGAPVTIIDGDDMGRVITISSDPTDENLISGFTIQNGNAHTAVSDFVSNGYHEFLGAGINIPLLQLVPKPSGAVSTSLCGGGGIFTYHITTINDCTIRYNSACVGGGIYNAGQLTVNRTTVYDNTADIGGGGILNEPYYYYPGPGPGPGPNAINGNGMDGMGGQMWLTNCTISGNSLIGEGPLRPPGPPVENGPTQFNHIGHTHGAGILNYGTMTLLNCTIAFNHTNNDATAHGGGFANIEHMTAFTAYFKNTIVANNTAGDGVSHNGYTFDATTVSQGNNLDSGISCGFNQPTDQTNINPFLGPLQDNGGPTFTHAIECTSPAANKGTNTGAPPTDQRGITRPQNDITDVGAYETECTPPVFVGDMDQATGGEGASTVVYSPNLNTNNLAVNPSQTVANRPVTITANVVNEGGMTGSTRVALKINGQVEQTKLITVGPGGSRPVKFTVTKAEPGTYTVIMGSQRASFLVTEDTASTSSIDSGTIVMILLGVLVIAIIMVVAFSFSRRPSY